MVGKRVSASPSTADRDTRRDRRASVSCRSSKHRRTIARTALGSRTRNRPSKSYSIRGSQHPPDELSLDELRGRRMAIFRSNKTRTLSSKQVYYHVGRPEKTRQNQPGTFEKASRGAYSERVSGPDRSDHWAQSQARHQPDDRMGKR